MEKTNLEALGPHIRNTFAIGMTKCFLIARVLGISCEEFHKKVDLSFEVANKANEKELADGLAGVLFHEAEIFKEIIKIYDEKGQV